MTRRALWVVALALVAGVASAADKARSRDGSGSSGQGSGAGGRHHASPRSGGSSGSERGSRDSASSRGSADPTDAQRRHPRAGTGTGDRFYYGGRPYSYHSYYGSGYYPYNSFYFGYPGSFYGSYYGYNPYYAGYGYGYGPGYGPGYGSGPAYGHGYGYRDTGSLRVLVDPEKTRVYVDGYYAGIADDFDGVFQRLHISPGRHDITLKLDGYRSHRFRVYVPVGHTVKLHHGMVRGTGEDDEEIVGQPEVVARPAGYARLEDEDEYGRTGDPRGPAPADAGMVRLDVRPTDASIYVDGAFRGTARDVQTLPLSPGRHRVEIVRPGYRTLERDVEVRPGETTDVRADLDRS